MTKAQMQRVREHQKDRHADVNDNRTHVKVVHATENMFLFKEVLQDFVLQMLKAIESGRGKTPSDASNGRLGSVVEEKRLSSGEIQMAEKAHAMIVRDIRQRLSIAEIANAVGTDWSRLAHVFKRVYGLGMYQCLRAERMRVAKELVTKTDKPFSEIASLVGYKGYTFVYAYTQYHHQAPAADRAVAKSGLMTRVKEIKSLRRLNH